MSPSAPSAMATLVPAPKHRMSCADRKRQLIANAIRLFSQRGFSGTRTKDIAAACDVSEGILFRHFATKEDLYHAILQSHADEAGSHEFLRELQRCAAAKDDLQLIRNVVRNILKSFHDNAEFHRLLMYAWLEGHAIADLAHRQLGLPMLDFLRRYVVTRQRDGVFRAGDPDALVVALYSPALQIAMNKYIFKVEPAPADDEATVEQLSNVLLAGLQQSAPKTRK